MATRILMADVSTFVENALKEVRAGLEAANTAGIQAEIPEKMEFALEIVSSAQSLQTETTKSHATTQPTETTTEAAVLDSEVTARLATQATAENGNDVETSNYTYDSFEEA